MSSEFNPNDFLCQYAREGEYLNVTNSEDPGKTFYCRLNFGLCPYGRFVDQLEIIDTNTCPLSRQNNGADNQNSSSSIEPFDKKYIDEGYYW